MQIKPLNAMQPYQIILLLFPLVAAKLNHDYYWRDYTLTIPADAVPGGKDINGQETYIGQTYVHGVGVFVMQIFPGKVTEYVSAYGRRKPSDVQRILCSKKLKQFKWMKTSAQTFHLDIINKIAVIGGYDHLNANKGMLQVGRLMYDQGIVIGSVTSYQLENAQLWFIGNKREQKATLYEVLLIQDIVENSSTEISYF